MKEEKMENIIKYFIDNCIYELMFDDIEIPNISFDFKEDKARKEINTIIIDNIENKINEKSKIIKGINFINYNNPVIEVHDYKLFFHAINKFVYTLYNTYMNNCYKDESKSLLSLKLALKYIWLRMTPDDFKNPENFLLKNIEMLENKTFNNYYKFDGKMISLNDTYDINFNNRITSTFDEENKEISFYIESKYLKKYYLPVVRYGIYKKNNKNVCEIGSIQNKKSFINDELDIVNELRKNLNKGVPHDLKHNIEPKKVLSLILFIKLLNENNIDEISIPSMYVLDYDYHRIWEQNDINIFKSKWSNYLINLYPDDYEKELEEFNKKINKVELISKNKTTDFIKLFERLMYHFPDIEILEYPNELSSYMKLDISNCKSIDNFVKQLKKS